MTTKKILSLFTVLLFIGVSACASPSTPQVTPTNVPLPTPTSATSAPPNVQSMIDTFVQENSIDPATVTYVSSEQLDWPDGCMGVVRIGYLCAMVVTPGYRITIQVNNLTVELHTNLDGSAVLLAPLSTASVQPLWADWTDELAPCTEAQLSDQEIFSGGCSLALTSLGPLSATEKTQLLDWNRTYAGFVAETPSGTLAFYGQGTQFASPDIQDTIAQWIDNLVQGSNTNATSVPQDLAISWSRAGGIAGFCDQMSISTSGEVTVLSCKSNVTPQPVRTLDPARLSQLNAWLAMYQPTSIVQKDEATADSMTVRLDFTGWGTQVMTKDVKSELLSFVSGVFNQLDV